MIRFVRLYGSTGGGDMFFELQFSAAVFGRILRNRLRELDLCPDKMVPNPDNIFEEMVLDQIVIGDSTTVQRELVVDYDANDKPNAAPGANQLVWFNSSSGNIYSEHLPYLQVKQEITITLVHPADLEVNGVNPSKPRPVTIYLVLNIAAQFVYHGPITMSYEFAYIDYGKEQTTQLERDHIADFIGKMISLPSATIDLGPMTQLLHRPVSTVNAGIACDPAGTRVALRADFDPMDPNIRAGVNPDFFLAGPDDLLAGREWATLLDASILIDDSVPRLRDQLHNTPGVKVLSDPVGVWVPATTTLHIGAEIKKLAACPGFVDDIDVDLALSLDASFSVVPGNQQLAVNYQIGMRFTETGQVLGCALNGTVAIWALYPIIAAAVLNEGLLNWSDYLGGIALGPSLTFVQLVGHIEAQSLTMDLSNDLGTTCRKLNDWQYECVTATNLPIRFVARQPYRLVLEAARGTASGLVLSGSVAGFSDYNLGPINGIEYSGFDWRVVGSCNSNRDGGGSFRIANTAGLYVDNSAPTVNLLAGHICSARVLHEHDPLGVFSLTEVTDTYLTVEARYEPAYSASPYDCVVRLVTNRGVRNINFGKAHDITPEEHTKQEGERRSWHQLCESLVLTTLPFDELFKVPTGPAPPVEIFGVDHWVLYRDLTIGGLAPNAVVTLRDTDTHTAYLSAAAGSDGTAQLRTLTKLELPIVRTELYLDFSTDTQFAGRPVERQQILYAHRSDIPVSGQPRSILVHNNDAGRTYLSLETDGTQYAWDISMPEMPTQITNPAFELGPSVASHRDEPPAVKHVENSGNPLTAAPRRVIHPVGQTRAATVWASFGAGVLAEFVPEVGAIRIYQSAKVGRVKRGRLPAASVTSE
jgi:hypothetical protein